MPDWGQEPPFYLDMTATGAGVNPVRKNLDKDVYDSTYWDSNGLTANVMPWLPFFSNCEGYDSHLVLYDLLEYNPECVLPAYEDIRVVNPIPSTGLSPHADLCQPRLRCLYDEPIF